MTDMRIQESTEEGCCFQTPGPEPDAEQVLRHKAHPVKEGAGLKTKCRDIAIPVVRGPALH